MKKLIPPSAMRTSEESYFAASGVPSISVMERAAAALCYQIIHRFGNERCVYFACGSGGNGGDGYACARLYARAGGSCRVFQASPAKSPDGQENLRRLQEAGVPVHTADELEAHPAPEIWVDAIFGTGLSRAPAGDAALLIRRMNADQKAGASIVAADIPSGLNGESGLAYDPCVQADITVSFQLAKCGHYLQDGLDLCGEIITADVGFPDDIFPPALPLLIEENDLCGLLPERRRNIHKGSCGHLLIIAGSMGMAGAAALCARAALRSGVGLVTICCPEEIIPILQIHAPCAMCTPLRVDNLKKALPGKTAIAIGPGLTRDFDPEILKTVLESGLPAAIDADALNLLSEHSEMKALLRPQHLLTPHPGEAARLLGRKCCDPVADAREISRLGCTAVLKGASRAIASETDCLISAAGGSGMARGGSGDVLTGIMGALLAGKPGCSFAEIAAAACEIHGRAGKLAQQKYGSYAMNSADIIEFLPEVFKAYAD